MSLHPPQARETSHDGNAHGVVVRSHQLRTLGLGLGAVMVGGVLYRVDAPVWVWLLVALHGFAWPHIACRISRRSADPIALDRRFFMGDAALGGLFVAMMQFNLLPSVLLATAYGVGLITLYGVQLQVRCLLALVLACGITTVANGLAFAPTTDMLEILASLPLLVIFPITLGAATFALARRVRGQNRQLIQMSSIDNLSGLLNRNHWEDAVDAALTHHACRDAVMLLIDIDCFKGVNDQHGHTVGDDVIRRVGAVISSSVRDGDLAGRYGGDEFAVVLYDVNMRVAAAVAERIRSGVASSPIERVPDLHCTLSIGLAHCQATTRTAREWVNDADDALYRAKQAGRNRLVIENR